MPTILYIAEKLDMAEAIVITSAQQEGAKVLIVLPDGDPYLQALQEKSIECVAYSFGRWKCREGILLIRKIVDEHEVDIVHCLRGAYALANAITALKRRAAVKLVAIRDNTCPVSRFRRSDRLTILQSRIDKIVCDSQRVRTHLEESGVTRDRLITIYKGHDVHWYDRYEPADLREFDIPAGEFVVGCVATMRPRKGVDHLVQAIKYLPPSPRVHLLLVGEVLDERVEDLARTNNTVHQIHFAGPRNDSAQLMGACNVFVMPSVWGEGNPRALMEAMSQAVPVVVTAIGAMREVVEHRVSGRIVRSADEKELARAISSFLRDPRVAHQYGQAARKRVREHFSADRTVDQTMRMYEGLVSPAPE